MKKLSLLVNFYSSKVQLQIAHFLPTANSTQLSLSLNSPQKSVIVSYDQPMVQ
ncbi:hypothetical protein [Faecalibacillus intestinalis]|uniref:hypothetical protein n=1 Tax=Faecalibacillus intestinalis TaxID=1982626 RepID=UPI00351FD919